MQNPKTGGNRFNPDIRPSEIDTYTETNGEQTAEYKIINAHPIINGILNKLAFFRTHAAAVYYNRLANKTVKQKFDDVDAAVGELNEKLGKTYAGNLNDFVETGIYWVNYGGSANLPRDRAGALMVVSNIDHSYLVQFFGDTVDRYFIRHKEGDSWSAWKEYTTKSYVDNKFLIIDKLFTFPEGTTTRGTLNGDKGSIDNKGKTLINYSVLGVNSGSEFHVQNMVVNLDGSYSVIYDKQGANSFNARISMLFI